MLKWLDWTGRIVLAAFAIIIIYRFWIWWMPSPPETYLRTDLINAQEADAFYTGFATLAVVQFQTNDGLRPFSYITANPENAGRVKGFCYRLYELSVGYPSLRGAVENSEASSEQALTIEPPQVLSGNVIEARHGGKVTQYECDRINQVSSIKPNKERLASLQKVLAANGQWTSHVTHAQNVLIAFSQSLAEKRQKQVEERLNTFQEVGAELAKVEEDPTKLAEWAGRAQRSLALPMEPVAITRGLEIGETSTGIADLDELLSMATTQTRSAIPGTNVRASLDLKDSLSGIFEREVKQARVDLSSASGYLGSLKLTFSTIGMFSQEKGRWFWKSDQFYIRQDIADATYGSDFALDLSKTTGGFFSPKRIKVVIPEPRLLALDRYTPVLVAKPNKFKLEGDDPTGGSIEAALLGDLKRQLTRIEPQAIRSAKSILTAQIHRLVEADVGEIEINFSRPDVGTPTQLMDLLQLTQEQQKK